VVVASRNCGIDVDLCGGIVLETCSTEEICKAVQTITSLTTKDLESRSKAAQTYARTHFTKEAFSKAYDTFITTELHL